MRLDTDTAFAVIQRALEAFTTEVERASAEQARAQETIGSVEYEMDELRKLIAETALPPDEARFAMLHPGAGCPAGQGAADGSLARRRIGRVA